MSINIDDGFILLAITEVGRDWGCLEAGSSLVRGQHSKLEMSEKGSVQLPGGKMEPKMGIQIGKD